MRSALRGDNLIMKEESKEELFTNRQLWALLLPVMLEQVLNALMGMVDTMMVSNVGSVAISAVSLVDSINTLVIQVFSALAAGGTIICSQYLGKGDKDGANQAAGQALLSILTISVVLTAICVLFRHPLLSLIFGKVEADVMANSLNYFLLTALSYPFIAAFNSGSALFRAQGNSRLPMAVSVISNLMNVAGNAVLIFGLKMGVGGAALSTLISRIFCAVTVLYFLRKPGRDIVVDHYRKIRPDRRLIFSVLAVGVPAGVENGMFQFGKLVIQSTVSAMGTTAIAANAMAAIFEMVNGMPAVGMGIGLMTVVGQCIGAGRDDEAKRYIKKISLWAEGVMILSCLIVFAAAKPVTILAGMETEAAVLCLEMALAITIAKPLFWVPAFTLVSGMRAAGDVKFSMITSSITMWVCRVSFTMLLAHIGMGPMAVWLGMFSDWIVRGIIFTIRFFSGRWLAHKLV